jgi:sigma-B regulation protein RsbU (phosphoserine phosphatase)
MKQLGNPFAPAIMLMNQLRYPQKFALISLVFILPLVLLVYLLFSEINSRIEFAQKEIYGNAYLRPLIQLSQAVYQSRIDQSMRSRIAQNLAELEQVERQYGKVLNTAEIYASLQTAWQKLQADYDQNISDRSDNYEQLIEQIDILRARVGDTSNLILDPDLDTYYLMDANLIKLPAIRNKINEIQVNIQQATADSVEKFEKEARLRSLAKLVADYHRQLNFNLETSFRNNPLGNLRPLLTPSLDKFNQQLDQIYSLSLQVSSAKQENLSKSQYEQLQNLLNSNLDYSLQFWHQITDALDHLLKVRIDNFRNRQVAIAIFIAVILLIVVYLFVGFYQAVMLTVSKLDEAAQRMSRGEINSKALTLDTKDELGMVVNSFNRIASTLVATEAKFRSIFENSIDGIFQTTPEGKYLSVNPSLARIYGYDSAEQMLQELTDIAKQLYVASDRRKQFISLMETAGKVSGFESQVYRRDGSIIWISENARVVRDEQGKVVYYEGTVEDITQRKEAEEALAKANAQIQQLNAQLSEENSRMRSELYVARQLQQMILPRDTELKEIRDLEICGFMQPADEVGGDYYDVLQQGGKLKIAIGDVTGHGLESGMVMLMVQMAVRTLLTSQENDPIKFLSALNQALYGNIQRMNTDRNLTLALLDYEKGRMTISGQHEEIIVVRANGEVQRIDTMNLGFPIGLEESIGDFLDKLILHLETDDIVVLFTDGITEAENADKEMYGVERLCQMVQKHRHLSAVEICNKIVSDLRDYIKDHKIYDDITLLVLKQK